MIQAIVTLIAVLTLTLGGFGAYEKVRADRASDRADAATANLKAAQQRATDLALLWAGQVDKGDAALRQQKESDDAKFAQLEARARALSRRLVRVSADFDRLLRDASRQANAAAAPEEHHDAPAAIPKPAPAGSISYSERDFGQFVTKAAEAYADVFRKWHACVNTYAQMRAQEAK